MDDDWGELEIDHDGPWDDRVDKDRVTLDRPRALAHAIAQHYPRDLGFDTEQDILKAVLRAHLKHLERGTTREAIFRELHSLLESDGAVTMIQDGSGIALLSRGDDIPRLMLDDDGEMDKEVIPRSELLEIIEDDISEMTKAELINVLARNAERELLEDIVAISHANRQN